MAFGVVLFRTEHRRCFKYPVKYPYHHLFIKLWALFQNCRTVKIIQLENIGSALGSLGTDFGSMDFRKALGCQEITEASYNSFLDAELGAFPDISQGYRP